MKAKPIVYFLSLLGLIPLAIWCYTYIDYDLWYDEVYSLEEFALKDFSTTMFYYPAPNNHIFFNLTSQVFSRLFGYRDIFSAETHLYIFRSFQLLISLFTAFFSIKILKRFFGYKSSFLLYAILFTTIPYLNFSLQLRGYNMSALFIVLLVYYALSYINSQKKIALWAVLFSSLLLLYTIPSNLYALVAVWLILFFGWVYYLKKGNGISKHYLKPLLAVSIGAVLAFLMYLPILEEVVFNKYSNRGPFGLLYSFHVLRIAIVDFFSNRFFLLLFILPGIYIFYKKSTLVEKQYFFALAALFLIPFVLSFFHQKAPFPRVFVPLAPVFCMLLTILIVKFIDTDLKLYQTRILQLLVTVYCIFVFLNEMKKNDIMISADVVENNKESQSLSRNYYLGSFFKQDSTMQYLSEVYKGAPVLKLNQRDQPSTDFYLRKYNIPFAEIDTATDIPEKLEQNGYLFILTSFKDKTLEELKRIDSIQVEVLTPTYSFTNIISIKAEK